MPELSKSEYRAFRTQFEMGSPGTVGIPPGHAKRRILDGMERSHLNGMPMAYEFQIWRHLLAGIPSEATESRPAQEWVRPERLAESHAPLYTAFGDSWFLVDDGTENSEGFFDEVLAAFRDRRWRRARTIAPRFSPDVETKLGKWRAWPLSKALTAKLDGIIDEYLDDLFPPPVRERWARRLEETASLLDGEELTSLRELAATAAWALRGELPLTRQPFPREIMRWSALYVLEP